MLEKIYFVFYSQKLIDVIENEATIATYPKVKEKLNLLNETVNEDIEHS